ncbi:MAG: type II toxin-antitoxin system RatA family toxin [Pseudomonadota bacterium]
MNTHAEKRILPFTAKQMYGLVADVEKYPEFLPWCMGCRITKRENDFLEADLIIGYKMLQESFRSKVTLHPHHLVDVQYKSGPLKYLNNHWKFKDLPDGSCEVDFYIDFAFHSSMVQQAMSFFFNEAVKKMIHAFEKRAHMLYKKNVS